MRLNSLLGDVLSMALGVPPLELSRQQVAKPPLEQRHDASQEEEPDPPGGGPEAHTGPLPNGPGVESVVYEMFQVLAHSDLPHESILVAVHARQLPDMVEGVLKAIGELVGIEVPQPVLDVRVDDQLGEAEDFPREVERISEAGLLPLLGGEGLGRFEVEVVVKVQVVELLAVDEQVEHVVPLTADLQPHLNPVQLGALEELGRFEGLEEVFFVLGRLGPTVELVENPRLEELLVGDPHLRGVVQLPPNALTVPVSDKGNINDPSGPARTQVERAGGVVEGDA